MAREVLDHGVVLPAEYSDDWYEDMTSNLQKLDDVIGSDGDKLSAGDVATVAISGDYDDLTNKPGYGILRMTSETLSDSGSGAISNLNSDSKLAAGDYVLDAALKVFPITAVSAPNFTVGTSLFQITNASALAAVATSGSYDDLNNLPAYGITRFVNAAISDNSNVAFANISSVDKIKAGDFLLDNAGKMYLISSVDSVNETAAVTTPLTVLALDSGVMHLSGNETASGQKTFSDMSSFQGSYLGNEQSTNARTDLVLESNRDTHGQSGIYITKFRQNKPQGGLTGNDVVYMAMDLVENSVRTSNALRFNFRDFVNDVPTSVAFYPTGINNSLGGSTTAANKWTKINGVEPGSLSLPDLNQAIDISGYITNFGAGTVNEYTPLADGWISIANGSTDSPVFIRVYNDYGFEQVVYSERNEVGGTTGGTYTRFGALMIPCVKNVKIYIIVTPTSSVLASAKFYPCLGNV